MSSPWLLTSWTRDVDLCTDTGQCWTDHSQRQRRTRNRCKYDQRYVHIPLPNCRLTGCQQNHQILKNFQRSSGFPLFWGLSYHLGSDQSQTLQFIDLLTSRHFATCFASDVKRWQTFEAEAQDNFPRPLDSLCTPHQVQPQNS